MCPVISIIAVNAERFWIWTNGSEKKNQRQQGYETAVCWTAEEAMDTIAGYLGVMEQTGRKVEE